MDLCNASDIKALLGRHGFHFSKSMGQNFLIDPAVPAAIAQASLADPACAVLEIGPGIGALTVQLARRAGKVTAVELDRALLPILDETLADCPNAHVIHGDILKLDLPALLDEKFSGFTPIVCANLPYNITTPVLTALLETRRFSSITVMIQREVAERICALPGSGDYGAFSVYCQFYAQPYLLFEVPPEAFLPAPKVTSAVIRLLPRPAPPVSVRDEAAFFRVVRAAFAQRRKTLLNALSAVYGSRFTKDALRNVITRCGLPPDVRGERLGLSEFAALTDLLEP